MVTPTELGTNWHTADTRLPGTGRFEAGPATPPAGAGSFELSTPDGGAKVQLLTDRYDGVALSAIGALSYSTYRDPASTGFVAGVAALNLRVDLDGGGSTDAYLVYEPYQDQGNDAVQTGAWQEWDAYQEGAARWWINTGAGGCGQGTPCPWSEILGRFPHATIWEGTNVPGSLGVNQGSGNPGIISNVDALTVMVSGEAVVYDFEEFRDLDADGMPDTPPPASKDECKQGAWEGFNNPSFSNQGQCVSYVQSNS